MIRAVAEWEGGYESVLSDDRGHHVVVDLPEDEDGGDRGTSALELSLQSLAGCVTTIFALVAERRRLSYEGLRIELTGDRPRGAPTITRVTGIAHVISRAPRDEVEATLGITVRTCPVGVLFHRAGVPVGIELVVSPPHTEVMGSAMSTPVVH